MILQGITPLYGNRSQGTVPLRRPSGCERLPLYARPRGVRIASRKGTGPCFRPSPFRDSKSPRRKMDQSPKLSRGSPSMPPLCFTREQSRQVDRLAVEEFGFCGLVLMENAGRGVADVLCRLGIAGPVVDLLRQGEQRRRRLRHRPASRSARPSGPRAAVGRAGRIDRRRRGQLPHPCENRRADRGFRRPHTTRPGYRSYWRARRGSSTACWAPARGANPARRWMR